MKFIILIIPFFIFAQVIKPLEKVKINVQKAKLGKRLFFDPILSKDKKISCASCHKPNEGWSDNKKVSIGVYGRKGNIHSLPVINLVYDFSYDWNGKFQTLQAQADDAIKTFDEMDMTEDEVVNRLNKIESYKKEFKKVFNDDIKYKYVLDAIAEYEKSLITLNSKFDLYLKGKTKLTKNEKEGYILFKKYGCITCHNGRNVGGNSFQRMGTIIQYHTCNGDRYEVTHNVFDKCVYRVPSLRNVTDRKRFFHDGSETSLFEVVKKMAYYNLGYYISDKDAKLIIDFLRTLRGKIDEKF